MQAATAFMAISAASNLASGVASYKAQKQQARNEEIEAYVAGTRALERDADARDSLNRTLSSIRAAVASTGGSLLSPTTRALMDDATETSNRDRLRTVTNERIMSSNYRRAAAARRGAAPISLLTGLTRAGPSLISLSEMF